MFAQLNRAAEVLASPWACARQRCRPASSGSELGCQTRNDSSLTFERAAHNGAFQLEAKRARTHTNLRRAKPAPARTRRFASPPPPALNCQQVRHTRKNQIPHSHFAGALAAFGFHSTRLLANLFLLLAFASAFASAFAFAFASLAPLELRPFRFANVALRLVRARARSMCAGARVYSVNMSPAKREKKAPHKSAHFTFLRAARFSSPPRSPLPCLSRSNPTFCKLCLLLSSQAVSLLCARYQPASQPAS